MVNWIVAAVMSVFLAVVLTLLGEPVTGLQTGQYMLLMVIAFELDDIRKKG